MMSDQLKQHFGDKVYRTIIPRNVRLAEAPSFGAPAMHYDKSSVGPRPIWPWLARSCAARNRSPSRSPQIERAYDAEETWAGQGLDALLSTSTAARQKQVMSDQRTRTGHGPDQSGELRKLPVEWLQSGKYQPRKDMSQDALEG